VTIDGVDVRRIELPVLRSAIAYVPQNPVLFSDTVMNNILLGRAGATREEAMQAARAANAHDFIEQLPLGYDTPVGENATRLSGGQRQRLALARAFLKDAPILILDEATSALDSESEARIQEALERLVKGRTVLIIAHRFSTLKLCDRVLVFEAGRIVASGRHDEVLADSPLYQTARPAGPGVIPWHPLAKRRTRVGSVECLAQFADVSIAMGHRDKSMRIATTTSYALPAVAR
jgi:subfamily B ATP-binding cassette protein MsbA